MTLKDLAVGKSAVITAVGGEGALRQHFLDMGVIPGAYVTVVKLAPMGDPMELRIHGYELTLRLADAEHITIEAVETNPDESAPSEVQKEKADKGRDGRDSDYNLGVIHLVDPCHTSRTKNVTVHLLNNRHPNLSVKTPSNIHVPQETVSFSLYQVIRKASWYLPLLQFCHLP